MRVLVTGGAGLLGSRLRQDALAGVDVHATWRRTPVPAGSDAEAHQADLTDGDAVTGLVGRLDPDVVVHTAYAVADGDRHIVAATANVAHACAAAGAGLVHLSSDVVFDGEHPPYGEDAPLLPVSEYGRQKAQAEAEVARVVADAAIVRTSLITWAEPLDPRSAWVAETLEAGRPLTLFTDEIRCPVRLDDLAAQVWELVALEPDGRAGAWHLVGPDALSRYDLGVMIARQLGLDIGAIRSACSRDQPEPRPRDLRLTTARANSQLTTRPRSVTTLFP